MKLHAVGAELFHADGWTDRWTGWQKSLFAILQTCLQIQNSPVKLHLPERQINIQ